MGPARHILAPLAGAAGIAAGAILLDSPVVGILVGGLLWAGAGLVLAPDRPFARILGSPGLGADAPRVVAELEEASRRVGRIRAGADDIAASAIRSSLLQIADAATAILADLQHSPKDYARMRKPLAHYLSHAETIGERVRQMEGAGAMPPAVQERTARTLADLEAVFADYRRRMVDDDAFDLDARIALLEESIRAEGIPSPRGEGPADKGGRRPS